MSEFISRFVKKSPALAAPPINDQVWVPLAQPPQVTLPSRAIYESMGQEGLFRMLEDFYELLGASAIAHLFAPDEAGRREQAHRSAAFFVGITGGPPLFHERHGEPRLRARHLPFAIRMQDREEWLRCFYQILDQAVERYGFPAEHLAGFRSYLTDFSIWMVNRQG